jgi:hypothetical protein
MEKKIKNKTYQIGCGYCTLEKTCEIRDSKVNKAKLGYPHFIHYTKRDYYDAKTGRIKTVIN